MNFSCTACGARLSLPDEQVVNRILKIRCTSCDFVMTVRNGVTDKHPRPGVPMWVVTLAGEQQGPMPLGDIAALVEAGRVDGNTYTWREGMAEWRRVSEVPELAALLAAPPPIVGTLGALAEAPAPTPTQAPAPAPTQAPAPASSSAPAPSPSSAPAPSSAQAPAPSPSSAPASYRSDPEGSPRLPAADRGRPSGPAATRGSDLPAKEPAPPQAPDDVSAKMQAELAALSREFSVVTRLERSKRRRWMWIGLGLVAAAAIAAIVVLGPLRSEPPVHAVTMPSPTPYDEVARIETPPREPAEPPTDEPESPPAAEPPETADIPARADDQVAASETRSVKRAAPTQDDKLGLVVPAPDERQLEKTRERFAAVAQDEVGKSEAKVDPRKLARANQDGRAEPGSPAAVSALRERVVTAFGNKRGQFAKCSDETPERVKVTFTVKPTGKTVDARVEGTESDAKARCIRAILDRSLFPAGDAALTYGQTLVL